MWFRSASSGSPSTHRESAASGPRTGATASPVSALLILRMTAARGTRRPGKDAVQLAGRLRQVIHIYCVQICSTTSNCMSSSRANWVISSSVMRTPLQVSYCLACGGSPLNWRNGLYQGTIQPKVERDNEHQQVALTFEVIAGKRARLTAPDVTGDTKLPPEEVAKAARYKGWFRWKLATASNQQTGVRKARKRYNKDERLTANVALDHVDYNAAANTA